tara:strand:- start:1947 stop:2249 length:303 start_codon:yes stop_codon:yes gene_type:complete
VIKESMFLFLLIGENNNFEEHYIGKVPNCDVHAIEVMKKAKQKYRDINGYLCINSKSFEARKKFMHNPTPPEQKVIDDVKELLPEPISKPLILRKKNENN